MVQQQQLSRSSASDDAMDTDQTKSPPAKRKRATTTSPAVDTSKKKAKRDVKPANVTPPKAAKNGKMASVKTAGAKTTAKKTENLADKGKKSAAVQDKKTTAAQKKKAPAKCKKNESDVENKFKSFPAKSDSDAEKDPRKKKKANKLIEKEIPSLMSFVKPRREASLNASVMVNIMFEKLPSPKKEKGTKDKSPSKSPAKHSPKNSPKKEEKNAAKTKSSADRANKASLKSQTEQKRAESQRNKSPKNSSKKKSTAKDDGAKKSKADASKAVKRKTKSRMASLNARALIAAERESLQMALERSARTDRYCVSWKHEALSGKPRILQDGARWVDGRGDTCCIDHFVSSVCSPKKEIPSPPGESLAANVADVKSPGNVHSGLAVEKDLGSDERPSSVVDVLGAHTPIKAPVLSTSACSYGSFGGLFGHSTPCLSPCPGYSYSHTEGYVTTSGYQSFTLSGVGTFGGVPMVTPTYRTSAFSVPYNTTLPYSYYPSGYYQPTAAPLLPQPMAQPACLLPHHVPVKVPHAQIKVLIHNPDTPQDLAAFSEDRSARKNGGSGVESSTKSDNNNNKNSGGYRGNTVSKSGGNMNYKTGGSLNSKSNGSLNSKSNGSLNSRSNGSLNSKSNGSLNRPNSASGKKQGSPEKSKNDSSRKKESHVVLKNRDTAKQAKRRYDKKKTKTDKEGAETKKEVKEKKKDKTLEHGWSWIGEGKMKKVPSVHMEQPAVERMCYQAIQHRDGDIVCVRDCVLLCSGPCKSDVPYVAKVGALWAHPETGEMMMSLLWYYQPEHTEAGRQPHDLEFEVFASRHRDENSVACIDDKCYVLTYDQFCRYRGEMRRHDNCALPRCKIVPDIDSGDTKAVQDRELPNQDVDPSNVFVCRKVYDFRQKRILKNPS